ncbi:uncharacterized protein N7511_004299 [Penicillium nucicola]|uniref:uncharacterized protein n=1 Tax=Penicillium nucicola TaxID=1850975 RepID=UPI0025451103|nr:uncharacterized protein N7511_004299 [Penicillium nucicola]KAJ5766683.1 hypothetical protein N7511_004299 [Penicillium nucicola]
MASHSAPFAMPSDSPALLQCFFGDFDYVKSLMKETAALLAVEPIIQKRSTVYIPSPVSAFLWHRLLTTRASYEATDEDFGSSYRRLTDGKSVTVKLFNKAKLSFFATHEICIIDLRGLYLPFNSISNAKNTVVCGPLKGRWQVDELDTLRRRGWTVHHYVDGELLDDTSDLKLEVELSLENGRPFLDEYSTVIEFNAEEDEALISTSTKLRVEDDTGIEVDLFGLDL